ncbi:hypothetical protein V8E54_000083 [Elaphomyces granulatus]
MPKSRPIQRPGKLALMQRVIENKKRRIEDVDRNRDGDQSIASDRPRPDELLPEYQGDVEEVAAATIEDDMIQLVEQAQGSQ